jgi:hypothetical protein
MSALILASANTVGIMGGCARLLLPSYRLSESNMFRRAILDVRGDAIGEARVFKRNTNGRVLLQALVKAEIDKRNPNLIPKSSSIFVCF